MQINFITFSEEYASLFYELNIVWLKKYFLVEPYDLHVLNNPKAAILENGGAVFFVEFKGDVIGTFALMPIDNNSFELMKMTVIESFRSKGVGDQILKFAINFCKMKNVSTLVLYSNTVLKSAMRLYQRNGFTEVALSESSPYDRADIKMMLQL